MKVRGLSKTKNIATVRRMKSKGIKIEKSYNSSEDLLSIFNDWESKNPAAINNGIPAYKANYYEVDRDVIIMVEFDFRLNTTPKVLFGRCPKNSSNLRDLLRLLKQQIVNALQDDSINNNVIQ